MRPGFFILLLSITLLTGCSSSGGWPGTFAEDPTAYDYPIVKQRWAAASQAPLGSAQDVTEIKAAVKKVHSDTTVEEIRWISPTEAMVTAVRGGGLAVGAEGFYGALKKDGDNWRVVAWYDDTI